MYYVVNVRFSSSYPFVGSGENFHAFFFFNCIMRCYKRPSDEVSEHEISTMATYANISIAVDERVTTSIYDISMYPIHEWKANRVNE